jgi:hypothetical protein
MRLIISSILFVPVAIVSVIGIVITTIVDCASLLFTGKTVNQHLKYITLNR